MSSERGATAIEILPPGPGRGSAAEAVLRELPGWFGIEEATRAYIAQADAGPTWIAVDPTRDGQAVGFLTLARHSPEAAEIIVMGVLPGLHRSGVGRRLVEAAEASLRTESVRFLQVKTLSDQDPDEGYARTRAFYHALGFVLLEELPDLWGPGNPCSLLVKRL